jgi:hypothetical protein
MRHLSDEALEGSAVVANRRMNRGRGRIPQHGLSWTRATSLDDSPH